MLNRTTPPEPMELRYFLHINLCLGQEWIIFVYPRAKKIHQVDF